MGYVGAPSWIDLGRGRAGNSVSRSAAISAFSVRGAGRAHIGATMSDSAEVLNFLRQLDAKVDALGIKVDGLSVKIDQIDQEHGRALELLRQDMTLLRQDVTVIRGTHAGQTKALRGLVQDGRMLRAAISDMAKENIMPGEIEVLHEDVSKLQVDILEMKGRLEIVESRDQN
jgi:hypothetical protein